MPDYALTNKNKCWFTIGGSRVIHNTYLTHHGAAVTGTNQPRVASKCRLKRAYLSVNCSTFVMAGYGRFEIQRGANPIGNIVVEITAPGDYVAELSTDVLYNAGYAIAVKYFITSGAFTLANAHITLEFEIED